LIEVARRLAATARRGDTVARFGEMLHGADLAMYAAKTDGKGTVRSYSPELTGIEPSRV
jgi:GGDEF domain-containing protein